MGQTMESCPPLILNLWDADGALDADDYLGMAMLHLNKPAANIINIVDMASLTEQQQDIECNKVPKPEWI
jgi:hypothetical protein